MNNSSYLEPGPEIPIFLRKTYALVDTCTKESPSICSWTNDGNTFTIFNQEQFEREQIPLYFKHSKFSSFVRQLNFYSFRKIKDPDIIRIDMERATQNHWKFKHELFTRGQPHRMADMKRMTGKTKTNTNTTTSNRNTSTTTTTTATQPTTTTTESPEVRALQQRIEEMNQNIHALTAMVEKVSLQQEQTTVVDASSSMLLPEPKRKKILHRSGSSMKIEEDEDEDNEGAGGAMVPEMVSSLSTDATTTISMSSPMLFSDDQDDDAFVEQLFQAFHDEASVPLPDTMTSSCASETTTSTTTPVPVLSTRRHTNRPDPQLMQKLSDCLEMLPKPIQEMIVTRLIEAITEGLVEEENESQTTLAALVTNGAKKLKAAIPVIPVHV